MGVWETGAQAQRLTNRGYVFSSVCLFVVMNCLVGDLLSLSALSGNLLI